MSLASSVSTDNRSLNAQHLLMITISAENMKNKQIYNTA